MLGDTELSRVACLVRADRRGAALAVCREVVREALSADSAPPSAAVELVARALLTATGDVPGGVTWPAVAQVMEGWVSADRASVALGSVDGLRHLAVQQAAVDALERLRDLVSEGDDVS